MINASEAKQIANNYNNGMARLLEAIKQQAEAGECALYVVKLTETQKSKLEQAGFKVTNYAMATYYDISWD